MYEQALSKMVRATKKLTDKPTPDTLLYGTVSGINPLQITLQSGLVIKEPHLFLGEALRPHNVSMPHKHQYSGDTESSTGLVSADGRSLDHNHKISNQTTEDVHKTQEKKKKYVTIEMYPPLDVSDIVLVFAFNDFQKFYVAERIKIGDKHTKYDKEEEPKV